MKKISKNASTALFPVPVVLITCKKKGELPNIITISWTGILNSNPPIIYISLRPSRYSYSIIKETGEFCLNIPSEELAKTADYCGVVSGKEVNKFKKTGLTPVPATYVNSPLIKECPVSLECRVKNILSLGSHNVFIAEVLGVHYDETVLKKNGMPDINKIRPYSLCLSDYRATTAKLGYFGFSKKGSPDLNNIR